MKILIGNDLKEEYINQIEEIVPEAEIVKVDDSRDQWNEINDTNIMVSFSSQFDNRALAEAEDLEWIQSWSAGVDKFLQPEIKKILADNNIKLTNASGVHSDIITEHMMGMAISFSRKLYKFYEQQQSSNWDRSLELGQLKGRTMAIVGLGSIGQELAARAKAFKMKVIGIKRDTSRSLANVDQLYKPDQLHDVLAQADYVTVLVPLTTATEGMFGKEEFKVMKKSAVFLNAARGEVVKENELIKALKEGEIAGAGLDVFEEEPLPAESPLYEMDNVLITPHVAGIFPDYNKEAMKIFLENLERYKKGKELINLVDYDRGY